MNITIDGNADIILWAVGFCLCSCLPSELLLCSRLSSSHPRLISRSWRSRRLGGRRTTCGLLGSRTGPSWRRSRSTSRLLGWRSRRSRGISGCSWCRRRSWERLWWRSRGSQRSVCYRAKGMKRRPTWLGYSRGSSYLRSSWSRQFCMCLIQRLIDKTRSRCQFKFRMFIGLGICWRRRIGLR